VIWPARPLGDDTLRVTLAGFGVEVLTSSADVIEVPKPRTTIALDQFPQAPLTLHQREMAQVRAVELEEVEGVVVRPLSAEEE
jgi:hypothetical protein